MEVVLCMSECVCVCMCVCTCVCMHVCVCVCVCVMTGDLYLIDGPITTPCVYKSEVYCIRRKEQQNTIRPTLTSSPAT